MADIQIITTDELRMDDKQAVDELIAGVREDIELNIQDAEILLDGDSRVDGSDVAAEEREEVADPVQRARLSKLRFLLKTLLADLP